MNFLTYFREAKRYLTDPAVPWRRKIWFYVTVFYFFSPIDFLPDLIPGLGWLDDLIVLYLGLSWFARELKRYREGPGDNHGDGARTVDAVEYEVCPDGDREDRDS